MTDGKKPSAKGKAEVKTRQDDSYLVISLSPTVSIVLIA